MTTSFRIDTMRIDTSAGSVVYEFPADLTVLAGGTGVGKTTLLELMKFGLGGDGQIAPVVGDHVSEVLLSIQVGQSRFQLARSISERNRKYVRVLDLVAGEQLQDHAVKRPSRSNSSNTEPLISDLLMNALGLPTDLRAAPTSGSRAGARITFNDVFRYMYIPQSAINHEIAGSEDSYYEPKRRAVFELLFQLTRPEILELRSELNELNGKVAEAERDSAIVQQFLSDSNTESRSEAEAAQSAAATDEAAAEDALRRLRDELNVSIDSETQTLRDLLTSRERALVEAREWAADLAREKQELDLEKRRVEQDIARLNRMASAGERLANIEFVVCPRCTQRLDARDVPVGKCRVCLLDDVVADLPEEGYERRQLADQVAELDRQIQVCEVEMSRTSDAAADRETVIAALTRQIDERTASRVTPRLQAYADAASAIERSRGQRRAIERVLLQWDRAEDLRRSAATLSSERSKIESRIASMQSELAGRRHEVILELSDEFQATVAAFGIPGGQLATINPTTYLPMLAGRPFDEVSSAGGIATATQVAYWLSLITVASRRRDTLFPAFLLIDSPRLALNTAEDIASQMYRRFVTQVDVLPRRLQFIIADNELPSAYGREFSEITFSYESPTISSVAHPGPARVQLLTEYNDGGRGASPRVADGETPPDS